jgi:hypothetical protein
VSVHEPYDPDVHGTYGEWLRSKNIQTRPQGWTSATRDQVVEGRDRSGRRFKRTTDQLGNDVIQHGDDQQSVIARPRTVQGRMGGSPVSDQRKG